MSHVTDLDLTSLLSPRSVAIIGASEAADSWAPAFHRTLREFGFRGPIVPVNPKHEEVWGARCWSSSAVLPEPVDLGIVVVPAADAVGAVEAAARRGVRAAMVVASGFAESGAAGARRQDELAAVAREHGILVLGPSVEGFFNYRDRFGMYAADLPPDRRSGGLTVISQSGAVVWYFAQAASDRAVGMRLAIGVGTEAALSVGDLLSWAAADADTRVIACYVESFRDVPALTRGIDAAAEAGKPVLFCAPPARGEAARRAVVAHTGLLAGNTRVRDAWLRRAGVLLVRDPVEMFESAVLLLHHQRVRTGGVAAAMEGGADATLFADAAEAEGLELPPLRPGTERQLREVLPPFANPTNPLDVTGQSAFEPARYCRALEALANDPSVGVIVLDAAPPRGDVETYWALPTLREAERIQRETGVAFVSTLTSPLAYSERTKEYVAGTNLAFLHGHRPTAIALRSLLAFQTRPHGGPRTGRAHRNRPPALRLICGSSGPLDQDEAARLLELYGIETPAQHVAQTADDAVQAASSIGFPVAVKVVARELPHKQRVGGVALWLSNADEVRGAAARVLEAAARVGVARPRLLVQRMVTGAEILVGGVVDEQFGPAVTVRPGGALAELGDARFHATPISATEARRIVERESESWGLHRGQHDAAAVASALLSVARFVHDLRHRLLEVEVNPLVVGPRGALAVDAMVVAR
jgi:acyl-CoA synthetase (NDP forming)